MARVKIKSNSNNEQRKLELLELLSRKDIYTTELIQTNDGFVTLTSSDADLDNIFNNETDKTLIERNFVPQIPPQLKDNRSVILLRVDGHISQNDEKRIKEELKERNDWVTNTLQVHKFSSDNIVKVTFSDSQQAKTAQEAGLKLFSMRVPKYNIKQDKYYHANVCLRCSELDTHNTNQCAKGRDYKIRSECNEQRHLWKDCRSNTRNV